MIMYHKRCNKYKFFIETAFEFLFHIYLLKGKFVRVSLRCIQYVRDDFVTMHLEASLSSICTMYTQCDVET